MVYNTNTISDEMYERCLDELYRASQPSITYKELIELSKEHPNEPLYEHYYLSDEESKYIIDKYISLYGLKDEFKDHCDLLIKDITEGCYKDKYIKPDNAPGYRGSERIPPLKEVIGEEAVNKIVEFIKGRKDYYKFDYRERKFRFNIFNLAPCTNKETVLKYWESVGKPITIRDKNPDYNFERHYLGLSDDELNDE